MSDSMQTSRRSFLKSGALVAAPAAAVCIPAAAMARDGSNVALARLQDERAIEALNRDFLRSFNRGGAKGAANLFADGKAPSFAKGVSKLSLDFAEEPRSFVLAEDGQSATARYNCTAEIAQELEGTETIVQMAKMQGNSASSHSARKTLSARYAKRNEEWFISKLELA